jgi:ketopantoate reductase
VKSVYLMKQMRKMNTQTNFFTEFHQDMQTKRNSEIEMKFGNILNMIIFAFQ